jgi:plasmid stabilization system protein ParE
VNFEISRRARRQIEKINTWWVEHRSNARWLFIDELDRAERLLRNPEIGVAYAAHRRDVVRRLLLPQSEHHLYYRYRAKRGELLVLAVWGAGREKGPKL